MMRGHQVAGHDTVKFALPHSLAFTFFPRWVMELRKRIGIVIKSRLIALNVHDAVMHFTEGSCDLLTACHHPSKPLQSNSERYELLSLDHETLAAFAKPGPDGAALFALPVAPGRTVSFPSYGSGAYLGRLVDLMVKQAASPLNLEPVHETDMAEALNAMASEVHGLAFLPVGLVNKDVKARRLVWRLHMPGPIANPCLPGSVARKRARIPKIRHPTFRPYLS